MRLLVSSAAASLPDPVQGDWERTKGDWCSQNLATTPVNDLLADCQNTCDVRGETEASREDQGEYCRFAKWQ